MKRIALILALITLAYSAKPQVIFKTLAPQGPVVAGESFQVQYIIEDADKVSNFFPPEFKGFRLVAGPNTYSGSMMTYNISFSVYMLSPVTQEYVGLENTRRVSPGSNWMRWKRTMQLLMTFLKG